MNLDTISRSVKRRTEVLPLVFGVRGSIFHTYCQRRYPVIIGGVNCQLSCQKYYWRQALTVTSIFFLHKSCRECFVSFRSFRQNNHNPRATRTRKDSQRLANCKYIFTWYKHCSFPVTVKKQFLFFVRGRDRKRERSPLDFVYMILPWNNIEWIISIISWWMEVLSPSFVSSCEIP